MSGFIDPIVKVIAAIIVVAIVAAVLSKKSQSTNVIKSAGSTFDWLIKTIVSPITAGTNGISALGGLGGLQLPSVSAGSNSYGFTI